MQKWLCHLLSIPQMLLTSVTPPMRIVPKPAPAWRDLYLYFYGIWPLRKREKMRGNEGKIREKKMDCSGAREALVVCSDRSMSAGITVWDMISGDQLLHIPTCAASPHGLLCLREQFLVASQIHRHGSLGGGAIFIWPLNKVLNSSLIGSDFIPFFPRFLIQSAFVFSSSRHFSFWVVGVWYWSLIFLKRVAYGLPFMFVFFCFVLFDPDLLFFFIDFSVRWMIVIARSSLFYLFTPKFSFLICFSNEFGDFSFLGNRNLTILF